MRFREAYDRIQNKGTALRSWIGLPIAVAIFVLIGVVRYFSRRVFWESWRWAPGGCASNSADIAPAYVSPVVYQGYNTCQQLALEAQA